MRALPSRRACRIFLRGRRADCLLCVCMARATCIIFILHMADKTDSSLATALDRPPFPEASPCLYPLAAPNLLCALTLAAANRGLRRASPVARGGQLGEGLCRGGVHETGPEHSPRRGHPARVHHVWQRRGGLLGVPRVSALVTSLCRLVEGMPRPRALPCTLTQSRRSRSPTRPNRTVGKLRRVFYVVLFTACLFLFSAVSCLRSASEPGSVVGFLQALF